MKIKVLLFQLLFISFLFHSTLTNAQNVNDFLVNEQNHPNGSDQQTPSIDGDGNGNFVMAWTDDRNGTDENIFVQIILNDNVPFLNNFVVNDDEGTNPQYSPNVAVGSDLSFVVTWLDRRNGYEWDIYAQRFMADGTPLDNNFKVNNETGNEEQVSASVSIDSSGNFAIVWADEKNGNWDIYGQRYLADGSAVGENFKVNDDIGDGDQYWTRCKFASGGILVVAWSDQRNNENYDIYAQIYSTDGSPIGSNFKVNSDIGNLHIRAEVAFLNNEEFIISWGDKRSGDFDIYAQRFTLDGTPIGSNFMINDNIPGTMQSSPTVSSDMNGNFAVCWVDNRNEEYDIYGQRFTLGAIPAGSNFKINEDTAEFYNYYPGVSMKENGNFLVIWEDHRLGQNGDIFAQHFSGDGIPIDNNYKINDDPGSANQVNPSIAKDGLDNTIYVWLENHDYSCNLYVQRFASDGSALGNNTLVNDDNQNYSNYYGPSVSASDAGDFVIAWTDYRYEYWGEIYAQRFSSNGSLLDTNFKVNILSYPVVYGAKVACKKNGDFIIVWGDSEDGGETGNSKGSEPDVWAQMFYNDGTPLGLNFKVNDDESDTHQTAPEIAIDSIGNFIICWNDNRIGYYQIYAQRYLSNGTPIDSNFLIVDSLHFPYPKNPSLAMDNVGNFVVSWLDLRNDVYDIWARKISNEGIPVGDAFKVNDLNCLNYESTPSISCDQDGKFVITWMDTRNGSKDIFGQRYYSDGNPFGDNFQISNAAEWTQTKPSVVFDNNRIYSAWQDNRGGQTGYDIWANILDWGTGVGIPDNNVPDTYSDQKLLKSNPNPFSFYSEIQYFLKQPGFVKIEIRNLKGKLIETMVSDFQTINTYSVLVDGNGWENGIYIYTLILNNRVIESNKMILAR